MHDGSLATLEDVVAFYVRGGNANAELDERLQPLELSAETSALWWPSCAPSRSPERGARPRGWRSSIRGAAQGPQVRVAHQAPRRLVHMRSESERMLVRSVKRVTFWNSGLARWQRSRL